MRILRATVHVVAVAGIFWVGVAPNSADAALRFDGLDDCTGTPLTAVLPTNSFSIRARIRLQPALGAFQAIAGRGEDDNDDIASWILEVSGAGFLQLAVGNPAEANGAIRYTDTSGTSVDDDSWHDVVATRDSSKTVTLYIDSVFASSFSATSDPYANNPQEFNVGCSRGQTGVVPPGGQPRGLFVNGLIASVSVWNRDFPPRKFQCRSRVCSLAFSHTGV